MLQQRSPTAGTTNALYGARRLIRKAEPNMINITLADAAETHWFPELDRDSLRGQEGAFGICLSSLQVIRKTKSQNLRYDSYALTQIVENPAGHFGLPAWLKCRRCRYIYEGTLILAALASGFKMVQPRRGYLNVTFNICERSLRSKTLGFAKAMLGLNGWRIVRQGKCPTVRRT
jgi:hypothetical protein